MTANEKEYQELINTWNRIASTEQGQAVLIDILTECGVWGNSFDPESTHNTTFREGKRAIGLFILERMNEVDPKTFIKILEKMA